MNIIRWFLLSGLISLLSVYYFCSQKSPTGFSTPEEAGVSIILSSSSVTISDTAIIDSIGKEISIKIPLHLGYFIDSVKVEIYSDEALAASIPADTVFVVRINDVNLRDTLRFNFTFETPGTKRFKVTAYKQLDYISYAQATAIILGSTNVAGNTPPEFLAETPRSVYQFNDGDTVRITAQAVDADGDIINYAYIFPEKKLPRFSAISFTNGYFEWISEKGDTGVFPLIFTASDRSNNVKASTVIVLGNIKYNRPPVITTTPALTAEVGLPYKYVPAATDPDTGALSWTLAGSRPEGLYFDSLSGTIFWIPDASVSNSGRLTLSVTDDGDPMATTSQSFTIKVTGINRPPIVRSPNVATAMETPVNITVYATDADNDTLSFKVVKNPRYGQIEKVKDSVFTYTPIKEFKGVDTVSFVAQDAFSVSDTIRVLIFVAYDNQKPTVQPSIINGVEDAALTVHLSASDVENSPLTYSILMQPQFGKLEGMGADQIYVPNQHFYGSDTLIFSVNDGALDSDPAKVILLIAAVNDTPSVGKFGVPVGVNSPVVITLPITDPDDSVFTYEITGMPQHGKITETGSTSFLYTPATDFRGADTIYFKAYDSKMLPSSLGRVVVAVGMDNLKPIGTNQLVSVNEEASLNITLSGNDPESKPLTYTLLKQPLKGTAKLSGSVVVYQPYLNVNGIDTVAFSVNDGMLDSDPAQVIISILPLNDPPTLQSQTVTAGLNEKVQLPLVVNDIDDSVFTYKIVGFPSRGTLDTSKLNQNILSYTPNPENKTNDVIKVIALDAAGSRSDTALLTVTIVVVNSKPKTFPLWLDLPEDATKPIVLLFEDESPAQSITFGIAKYPKHGTFEGNFPAVSFKAAKDYNGSDTFWYWAQDPQGLRSDSARVAVTITPVNDLPRFPDSVLLRMVKTAPGQMVEINGLKKAEDVDDAALVYTMVSGPKNGSADTTNIRNGVIKYTPLTSFQGSDTIIYQAFDDEKGASNAAVIIVNVTLGNQAPVALAGTVTVKEDDSVLVTLGATDAETRSDLLSYTVSGLPVKGKLSAVNLQKFWYTPSADSSGTDELTFSVSDGSLTSNTAKVTISITPVNDAPVAHPKTYTIREDSSALCLLTGYDKENTALLFVADSLPKHGSLTSGSGASKTYQPEQNFFGADSFTYHVVDAGGMSSAIVKVRLTVSARDDRPFATPATFSDVKEDVLYPFTLKFGDADSQAVTVAHKDASKGTVTQLTNGSYTYLPDDNYFGKDSFTFVATDGVLFSDTAKVVFIIAPVNDVPVAQSQSGLTVNEDGTLPVQLTASDVDSNALSFQGGVVSHGKLTVSDSTATFKPDSNYSGPAQFSFTVSDGSTTSLPATITLSVTPVNDAPKIGGLTGQTIDFGGTFVDIILDDVVEDVDNADATLIWSTGPTVNQNITVSITDRIAHISAKNGWSGNENVTFIVKDPEGAEHEKMVSFGVRAAPDLPPTISSINNSIINEGGTTGPIGFTIGDDKTPVTELKVTATSDNTGLIGATGIQLSSVAADMTITVTPTPGLWGTTDITLHVEDEPGQIAEEKFTLRVNAIPEAFDTSRSIPVMEGAKAEFNSSEIGSDEDGSIAGVVFTLNSQGSYAKYGTVEWVNNKIVYTLGARATLGDIETIIFQVQDDNGALSTPKTITININVVF